jgi:type I restriction enzyme S subunit
MLHSDSFVNAVIARCSGSNYPAISPSDLSLIPVGLPLLSEQQKIADCLSSLDEVIELQTKKLEALKAHKRGLMQQLFPQEVG